MSKITEAVKKKVVHKEYYPDGTLKNEVTKIYYSDVSVRTFVTKGYLEVTKGCEEVSRDYSYDGTLLNQVTKIYYPDGTLQYVEEMKASNKTKAIKEYYPDKTLKYIGEWIDGDFGDNYGESIRIGEHKYFHKNGQLELVERFRKNGRRIGDVKGFYKNGNHAFIENYKTVRDEEAAFQHGYWFSYSEQGDINKRMKYKNGDYIEGEGVCSYIGHGLKAMKSHHVDSLDIWNNGNCIKYDSNQLSNDIVFRHFKREILLGFACNEIDEHDLIECTDGVPERIRNDEDIACEAIDTVDYTWLPIIFKYLGDELKSDKDFIEHYYDCFRNMLKNEYKWIINEQKYFKNPKKVVWKKPDSYSKNDVDRFLSIILELKEMDKRIININFKKWVAKKFKNLVTKEFFESLYATKNVFEIV